MALNDYIIKYSSTDDEYVDGAYFKPSFVIGERSTNTTDTSLTLIGKNSVSYGEDLQTNIVHLLENFARNAPPTPPTIGQLWYDTGNKLLKVFTPDVTGGRWVAVGAGSAADIANSLPVASPTKLGSVKVGAPFNLSEDGTVTLPNIAYVAASNTTGDPAEYIFSSNARFGGEAYSSDLDNYIVQTANKPADFYDKYFLTKHYADNRYVTVTSQSEAGKIALPAASKITIGAIMVGTPFAISSAGTLSLDKVFYHPDTATDPAEYLFNANIFTSKEIYSVDSDNFIGSNPSKTDAEYACYFTTKSYADKRYIRKGDMSVLYILPPATNVELGGIMVKPPFLADATGKISLKNLAYDETDFNNPVYSLNTHFVAKNTTVENLTANNKILAKKEVVSFDNDNFIAKDPAKLPADYNNYFITKHYADSRYFLDPNAGTSNVGVTPTVATANKIGGVIVGAPFTVSPTGQLTLPNLAYGTSTDPASGTTNSPQFEVSARLKVSGAAYSSDPNNSIGANTNAAADAYDAYFTTKKYTDTNYLKSSTVFDSSESSKSKHIIEYASGFSQTDFTGKDNALVNKKYVDEIVIGPQTLSGFDEGAIVTSVGGVLKGLSDFTFDGTSGVLTSKKTVLADVVTDNKKSLLTVYNTQPSSTAGASLSLNASEPPITPTPGQPSPTAKPAIVSTTKLGSLKLGGWDGTEAATGSTIDSSSTEPWSDTAHGSNLVLSVTKNGTKDPSPAVTINNDKSVLFAQCMIETISHNTNTNWTVDLSTGSIQVLTTSDNTTIVMPAIADVTGKSFTVIIKYKGSHTITWSGGVISWPDSNDLPIPTSADNATDIFTFFGDGDKLYGSIAGQGYLQ